MEEVCEQRLNEDKAVSGSRLQAERTVGWGGGGEQAWHPSRLAGRPPPHRPPHYQLEQEWNGCAEKAQRWGWKNPRLPLSMPSEYLKSKLFSCRTLLLLKGVTKLTYRLDPQLARPSSPSRPAASGQPKS